ncbi:uncharacterized protein PAC_19508 [Phialocephala subalpina]|uniref:SHSP domain-containing protein n=1 Tax=Phialocephala subalpina TaxID=576137 RepID=A0A1L7XX77_9HELO|nr:uncharacterized protein PAC_19508 [Phialocephala subalpina]
MATINCLFHPHHISLGKTHTSIHMLHQHIDDPYYGLDRRPSHEGVSVPKFDRSCEFIENQTLVVRGAIEPKNLAGEKELPVATAVKGRDLLSGSKCPREADSKSDTTASAPVFTWKLKERHVGKFERSFTFPSKFKSDGVKTSLEFGVLSIALPKDKEADLDVAAKMEIENELS